MRNLKKLVYFFIIIIYLAIVFATTFAEENEQSTTQGVYYGIVSYHALPVEDEIFLASPSKIDGEIPSTMPIIILGHLPKANISVELWDSPFNDVSYLYKKIDYCYFSTQDEFDIWTVKRYNLKMKNSHRYQIRVYLLDGKGNKRLVVSNWFIKTIANDEEYTPPKEQCN